MVVNFGSGRTDKGDPPCGGSPLSVDNLVTVSALRLLHIHVSDLQVQNALRFLRVLHCWVIQPVVQTIHVQIPCPFRHYQRCHTITHQVGQRPRLRHKAVNSKNKCQTRHWYAPHCGQGGREHNKPAACDTCCALGGQHQHCQQGHLLHQRHRRVRGLGDENRCHGQVN